jgi:hypothetical protein
MPRRALVELIARRNFFLALHYAAILADSRLLFAFATSAYDLSRFCITRGHDHFLHLYFTWLLLVNDSSLRSQLLLIAACYIYSASGLSKLLRGGLRWTDPRTFESFLYKFPGLVSNRWLARLPSLCRTIAFSGIALELIITPTLLLCVGGTFLPIMVAILISFHVTNDLLMNMQFYLTYPGLLLLLELGSHQPETQFLLPGWLILLGLNVFFLGDSWPLNTMELFPFNYLQMKTFEERTSHFRVALRLSPKEVECATWNPGLHFDAIATFFSVEGTTFDKDFMLRFPELWDDAHIFDPQNTIVRLRLYFQARTPIIHYETGEPCSLPELKHKVEE